MKEKKQIKNKNAAKILTEFVLTKYREMNEKQLQNEIFQMEKDEEELLIEEISKKITSHILIQSQKEKEKEKELKLPFRRNSILFDTNDPKSKKIRNIEAIYLTLLKFKGLKRYMSYQGLCPQDIRNISCYIKHGYYEKGSYIVRQFDKSNALYGIIKGSVEVRELETIDKTKNIISSITDDNGEDDEKMDKIFKKIPRDYFMSDIESDDDNKNEFNIIKNNFIEGNEYYNSDYYDYYNNKKNDFYSRRKIKKKLKTVKNISPIKQEKKNSNNLIKKRYSLIKKIAIEEHQTPFEELKGSTLENFKLDFEEKRVTLKKGMCFGEWGIVYNIPRTTSIYCPENTHIFYLEKKYFNKILLSKFLEGDMKKVQFIIDRIPKLKKDLKIRNLLTKIPPEFYEKNHIVYTPFDEANTIYLVYKGECIIGDLPFNVKSKKDYLNKFEQIQVLSFLDEGGIAGLESSQGYHYYKHCLIIKKEFTILLKLNVDYLQKIYFDFGESITPLFNKQNIRIEEFKIESEINKKKMEIRNQIIKDKIKEFKKELNKPFTIIKEHLLKQKKSILNNEKLIHLTKKNYMSNQSIPFLSKTKKYDSIPTVSTNRDSSNLNIYQINPYSLTNYSENKKIIRKIDKKSPNIYQYKIRNIKGFFNNKKSVSTDFNSSDNPNNEKRHSIFSNSTNQDNTNGEKKVKKIIKITENDIISVLNLPKNVKKQNIFGRNKSSSGHYNITFLSNLV